MNKRFRHDSGTRYDAKPANTGLRKAAYLRRILCVLAMQFVAAALWAQTVTLDEQNATLQSVLNKIRKQTGSDLVGDLKFIQTVPPISISVKDKPIQAVLALLSAGQLFELRYFDKTILVRKNPAFAGLLTPRDNSGKNDQRKYHLTGIVSDKDGKPVIGATVTVLENKQEQAQTDLQGRFQVHVTGEETLQIAMMGFETNYTPVSKRKHVHLALQDQEQVIDDVVVTGYGNLRAENFTGAARTITRAELEKFNNNNIFSILQSLDPALRVDENLQNGSNPNNIPQINIRGVASVAAAGASQVNAPLVVLNGFETTLAALYDLDINRIERISILKDASSTSLYGSRGGNGVIVIETRLPKDGKFTISYDMRPSITMVDLSDYNLMNAREKLAYEKLAGIYNDLPDYLPPNDFQKQHLYKEMAANLYEQRLRNVQAGVDTYWLGQPVQSTLTVAHSLRLEGGANQVQYSVEGNYHDFKGAMKESGRQRAGASFNLVYRIPDKFTFHNIANFQNTKEYNSPYGSFSQYANMNPYEQIYDANGNLNIVYNNLSETYQFGRLQFNPLYNASLPFRDILESSLISNNLSLNWFILPGLSVMAKGEIAKTITRSESFTSPFHTDFYITSLQEEKGQYNLADGNNMQYSGNLNVQYTASIGEKSQLGGNLVGELRKQNARSIAHALSGFADDRLISPAMALQYAEATLPVVTSTPFHSIGLMASAFYSYDNTYNLNVNYRLDGSSLFGAENRYGAFWSTGLSYNMHKEKWFSSRFVTALQLFGNYGINGNENFNADMVSTAYTYAFNNAYYRQYGTRYASQGNPALAWPQMHQLSLGGNIKFGNELLALSGQYYDKTTQSMISTITVAPSMGFAGNSLYQNMGKVANRGFEVSATTRLMHHPATNFDWYITLTAARNTNKILEISDELRAINESAVVSDDFGNIIRPSNYFEEGQSLAVIRAVPSLGIDPASGREMFLDRNGNATYTWDALDQRVVGNADPKLFGNVSSTLSYKSLTFQLFFNYTLGADKYNQTLMDKVENNDPYLNTDRRVLDERWQEPGQPAQYKSIRDLSVTQVSSRFVQRERFLRLASININYDLPLSLISRYRLQRARLNFSANDMFQFSNVRMERGIDYPFFRTYNFGLSVQF